MLAGPQREQLHQILDKMKTQKNPGGTPPGQPPVQDRSPLVDEVEPPQHGGWGNHGQIPIRNIKHEPPQMPPGFPPTHQPPPPIWNTAPPPVPSPQKEPRDYRYFINIII